MALSPSLCILEAFAQVGGSPSCSDVAAGSSCPRLAPYPGRSPSRPAPGPGLGLWRVLPLWSPTDFSGPRTPVCHGPQCGGRSSQGQLPEAEMPPRTAAYYPGLLSFPELTNMATQSLWQSPAASPQADFFHLFTSTNLRLRTGPEGAREKPPLCLRPWSFSAFQNGAPWVHPWVPHPLRLPSPSAHVVTLLRPSLPSSVSALTSPAPPSHPPPAPPPRTV